MATTSELSTLHRSVEELRTAVASLRSRYGDVPAVRRLLGDIDRLDLDASELDGLTPLPPAPAAVQTIALDDRPFDPALWADADDEGLGGYHR